MSINYDESPIAGTRWTRCHSVVLSNSYGAPPSIGMGEEELMLIEGSSTPLRTAHRWFTASFDPNAEIALRDPSTGQLTGGKTTQGAVHVALYSFYRALAEVNQ